MNRNLFYISFLFLTISCSIQKDWSSESSRCKVSSDLDEYFASQVSKIDFPMDFHLYNNLIESGESEFCAMTKAFALSEVIQERQLPNRCHRQYFNFHSVSAHISFDTLFLTFSTKNPRRSMASNKIVKVKMYEGKFISDVIHWGTEEREVQKYDGSIEIKKSPRSEVSNTKLKINKPAYEMGDTIIGDIKIVSLQKRRKGQNIHEITSGKFRAIIGGNDMECSEASLASSWIKD